MNDEVLRSLNEDKRFTGIGSAGDVEFSAVELSNDNHAIVCLVHGRFENLLAIVSVAFSDNDRIEFNDVAQLAAPVRDVFAFCALIIVC